MCSEEKKSHEADLADMSGALLVGGGVGRGRSTNTGKLHNFTALLTDERVKTASRAPADDPPPRRHCS